MQQTSETSRVEHARPGSSRPCSLVTGGAGFLGSHLCRRLLAEGHEVLCLDNLLTGSRENIDQLLKDPRFTFIQHDVTQPINLAKLLGESEEAKDGDAQRGKALAYVLHFASPASPEDYARYPIQTLKAGALGTHNALGLARAMGSVFLLASSSEVYGDAQVSPQQESYWGHVNPTGPRSVYDEAKRFAEALTTAYHREHGVKVRIARIFNTYGERMRIDDGRVLPNFLKQALQGKPLTVYGKGSQTRSLCYVDDMVEALYRLMLSNETGPVNLGNPEEVSILDLAHEVIELTRSKSTIMFKPLPVDDPRCRKPDISKAAAILGWRPTVSRREGIERVIPYFRSRVEALCAR